MSRFTAFLLGVTAGALAVRHLYRHPEHFEELKATALDWTKSIKEAVLSKPRPTTGTVKSVLKDFHTRLLIDPAIPDYQNFFRGGDTVRPAEEFVLDSLSARHSETGVAKHTASVDGELFIELYIQRQAAKRSVLRYVPGTNDLYLIEPGAHHRLNAETVPLFEAVIEDTTSALAVMQLVQLQKEHNIKP